MQKILVFIYYGTSISVGTAVTFFYENLTPLGQALLLIIFIDYLTGISAAFYEGKLSSKEGFKGILTKMIIIMIAAMAHFLGKLMNMPHLEDMVILFYLSNELLSIIENAGRMKVPIPNVIRNAVVILKNRGSEKS
ncbi:holin family protein [Fictibacillus aquaticus]|uniref:phage holin family protein n=1 Tax=Fictibacillus aquaticus TaxID=2021314 RepID=UPI0013FDC59E|nr:phage holin family protein [Fictibacillus aquaticus]